MNKLNRVSVSSGDEFVKWNKVKTDLHCEKILRPINEGDVWWCGVGKNVGAEINGKHDRFSRPVLVLKKLSRSNFIGVPLTSQLHEGSWYVGFEFQEKHQVAVVCQIRNFSVFRLYRRMGMIPSSDLAKVKRGIIKLLK